MTYTINAGDKYRPHATKIDLARFAADLARELAGELVTEGEYPNERQTIKIGADILSLGSDWRGQTVSASIYAPDVPHDDRNTYAETHKTARASVRPDARPIAAIARDIKRRVIDASQAAIGNQREYAAQRARSRGQVRANAEALRRALPDADVRLNEREQRATIYGGGAMHYMNATLNGDGCVSVERLGSLPLATFIRLVALLNEPKESA